MPGNREASWIISLLLCLGLASPVSAHGPGNHANVEVQGDDSAAAVCQVVVLVGALIILDMEDALGLVAPSWAQPRSVVLPAQGGPPMALADCSVVIERLSINLPDDGPSVISRTNHVSGPPAVLEIADARPGLEWRVDVTGAGSEGRICQVVVIVGSIIIGGAGFGIDPGDLPIIDFNAVGEGMGPGGDARCRAAIDELVIDGESLGPVEAEA